MMDNGESESKAPDEIVGRSEITYSDITKGSFGGWRRFLVVFLKHEKEGISALRARRLATKMTQIAETIARLEREYMDVRDRLRLACPHPAKDQCVSQLPRATSPDILPGTHHYMIRCSLCGVVLEELMEREQCA